MLDVLSNSPDQNWRAVIPGALSENPAPKLVVVNRFKRPPESNNAESSNDGP